MSRNKRSKFTYSRLLHFLGSLDSFTSLSHTLPGVLFFSVLSFPPISSFDAFFDRFATETKRKKGKILKSFPFSLRSMSHGPSQVSRRVNHPPSSLSHLFPFSIAQKQERTFESQDMQEKGKREGERDPSINGAEVRRGSPFASIYSFQREKRLTASGFKTVLKLLILFLAHSLLP